MDFIQVRASFFTVQGGRLRNGLVTEFELGLELDSAEVRGILIYEGQDWGHVVFDFRA